MALTAAQPLQSVPGSIANILLAPDGFVFDRLDLIRSLERMLGPAEWKSNGAMWRMRDRSSVEDHRALADALEDYAAKTPEQKAKIRNLGAWLTQRYEALATQYKKAFQEKIRRVNAMAG